MGDTTKILNMIEKIDEEVLHLQDLRNEAVESLGDEPTADEMVWRDEYGLITETQNKALEQAEGTAVIVETGGKGNGLDGDIVDGY